MSKTEYTRMLEKRWPFQVGVMAYGRLCKEGKLLKPGEFMRFGIEFGTWHHPRGRVFGFQSEQDRFTFIEKHLRGVRTWVPAS